MLLWLCLLAALAGVLNPVQSGANAELGRVLGNPFGAVIVSLCISLAFALLANLLSRGGGGGGGGGGGFDFGRLSQAPWWAWVGGFCGAIFLVSQPLAAPRLGAAVYIGVTVTASAIASVLLDHFGLLGFQQHTASVWRIIGAALMIAGVSLIARF